MFARHFRIAQNPFYALSDPSAIFESCEIREVVEHFDFARENRDAVFLLTGEVGTGKTTAIRAMRQRPSAETPVAVIQHATLGPVELLESLVRTFAPGRRTRRSRIGYVERLEITLRELSDQGRMPVVFFDEAHLFEDGVLEETRLLTNLRHEGHPILQVCLVGQPELAERLREPRFRQLRQRVSVRYEMQPMGPEDTSLYLIERIRAAGSDAPHHIFGEDAAAAIHRVSGGIPREINIIAAQAMTNAYVDGSFVVHETHVEAAREYFGYEGAHVPAETDDATETEAAAPIAPENRSRFARSRSCGRDRSSRYAVASRATRTASTARATSSSVVRQLSTGTRITRFPLKSEPPNHVVPLRWMRSTTSSVRRSWSPSAARKRTMPWLITGSATTSTSGRDPMPATRFRACRQLRSTRSARPSRPSSRSAA